MPPISDLVRDSKLKTHILPDHTVHIYNEVDQRRRRISRQESWKLERHLGQGSYGQVWLEKCTVGNSLGSLRAVKMVRKRPNSSSAINYNRELEAVAKFSHAKYEACFVKSFGWYEDTEAIYIAMEYCPHGDLHRYLSRTSPLPAAEAQELTRQILEGVHDMHENGFAHRDLKPANILIKLRPPETWWVKLADFGISKRAEDGNGPSTVRGTLEFMAPELLGFGNSAKDSESYNYQAVDMWALGEIAFQMLTGKRTFKNISALNDYCRGLQKHPSRRLVSFAGDDRAQFIITLMVVDPHLRMNATDALHHPWMMSHGTDLEIDLSASPISNSLGPQPERVEPPEESSTESIQEASARWSTVPNTSIIEPVVDSRARESSRLTSMPYRQSQRPSGQVEGETELLEKRRDQDQDRPLGRARQIRPVTKVKKVSGALLQMLEGHSDWVAAVAFSPDGKLLASASGDSTVRLWDAGSGAALQTLEGHSDWVAAVAFSPDGRLLASASNELLASASNDNTVRLWDAGSGAALQTLKGHSGWVRAVAFSPDGKLLASASNDNTVRLWDAGSRAALQTLEGHSYGVAAVAFSPDGKLLASASNDNTVRLWDAGSGAALQTLEGHSYGVAAVAFSPDGKLLASASDDNTVRLWDAGSRAALQTLEGHSHGVAAVAFSPDGRLLASASNDNTVRLWDAGSGGALQTLEGHSRGVAAVAFSPDGRLLASASDDNTVRLWDAGSGAALQTLKGHSGWVRAVAFSPDGRLLASASNDRTVRLWDAGGAVS